MSSRPRRTPPPDVDAIVYGNYVPNTDDNLVRGLSDQTMNVFPVKNPVSGTKYPLVIEIHGGGFYAKKKSNQRPLELENIDCVFASFEYRRVTRYYKDKDTGKAEKAIEVGNNNTLSESQTVELYDADYTKNFINRTNYALKCIYDCILQMNYLVDNADTYQIDLDRVFFFGASAGTLMCNYLTYVYSPIKNYNVVSTAYDNAQLNYSVESTSSQVFSLYEDEFGDIDVVSNSNDIFGMNWMDTGGVCESFLNPTCSDDSNEVKELCVSSHEDYIRSTYCKEDAGSFTLSDLSNDEKLKLTMPFADLKTIITNSSVVPEYCYVSNKIIGNMPHNKLYAKKYKEVYETKGVKNMFIRSGTDVLANTMDLNPVPQTNIEFIAHVVSLPPIKKKNNWLIILISVIVGMFLVWGVVSLLQPRTNGYTRM